MHGNHLQIVLAGFQTHPYLRHQSLVLTVRNLNPEVHLILRNIARNFRILNQSLQEVPLSPADQCSNVRQDKW